jgi:putative N-acetylmannosamine-6-phosphate epimerase
MDYENYVKSGAMHKVVGAATREAGAIAREHNLPVVGPVSVHTDHQPVNITPSSAVDKLPKYSFVLSNPSVISTK